MIWKTILVPHDFSSSANHAVAIARDEAKAHGANLLLLHVIDLPTAIKPDITIVPDENGAPINIKDYAIKQAEAHLADLAARVAKDGVAAQTFLRIGKPEDEIVKFATENKVDLIAMGTHGRTGLEHLLVGSVAERVVRMSPCAVLTIRSAKE
ncbi:MAG TPA: universal stress protein [Kofleriaceae bacterium]|nr:universal stress protein [Kofleriaceae bacterium]